MKLIKQWRGELIYTTKAENWWKEEGNKKKLFCKFSNNKFHGATECLELDNTTLNKMMDMTNTIIIK